MYLAEVVGNVVCTVKDDNLHAQKLMLIQPLLPDGSATGVPLVAVDAVGVGVGERVIYVRGKEASFPFLPNVVPTDAGIVARVDAVDVHGA